MGKVNVQTGEEGQAENKTQSQSSENNAGNDDNDFVDFWGSPEKKDEKAVNQNNSGQETKTQDQGEVVKQFMSELGFKDLEISDSQRENLGEDGVGLLEDMQSQMKTAMVNMARLMKSQTDQATKDATDQATRKATDTFTTTAFIEKMHSNMPFTKEPEVGVIAEAAAKNLFSKGYSETETLKLVDRLFERIADKYTKHKTPKGGDSGFGPRGDIDFASLLGEI